MGSMKRARDCTCNTTSFLKTIQPTKNVETTTCATKFHDIHKAKFYNKTASNRYIAITYGTSTNIDLKSLFRESGEATLCIID